MYEEFGGNLPIIGEGWAGKHCANLGNQSHVVPTLSCLLPSMLSCLPLVDGEGNGHVMSTYSKRMEGERRGKESKASRLQPISEKGSRPLPFESLSLLTGDAPLSLAFSGGMAAERLNSVEGRNGRIDRHVISKWAMAIIPRFPECKI